MARVGTVEGDVNLITGIVGGTNVGDDLAEAFVGGERISERWWQQLHLLLEDVGRDGTGWCWGGGGGWRVIIIYLVSIETDFIFYLSLS